MKALGTVCRLALVFLAYTLILPATSYGADECENWQTANPTWLFCDDFEAGNLNRWIDVKNFTTSDNPAHVHNGSYAAQLFYQAGSDGAGWMWKKALRSDNGAQDAQYVRWWQKWEDGFAWASGSGDQKLFMLVALSPQDAWAQTANWKLYLHLIGTARINKGVAIDELYIDRFIWDGGSQWSGQWQGLQQNQTVTKYRTNVWECTEVEVIHNTPGQANGTMRVWINDQLVMQRMGIKFRDDPISWNALMLNAWYGSPGVPKNQYGWVDQVVVSTDRINCASTSAAPPEAPKNVRIIE